MVMGVCLLASAILMLVRGDSNLLSLIPGGWDTGALTLGAAGGGVHSSRRWASASATACSASAAA
jgi:hypothetical protein